MSESYRKNERVPSRGHFNFCSMTTPLHHQQAWVAEPTVPNSYRFIVSKIKSPFVRPDTQNFNYASIPSYYEMQHEEFKKTEPFKRYQNKKTSDYNNLLSRIF
jgi:hypothetical protein